MKIKITEEQLKKIEEDNLVNGNDPVDGFIQQGNISGLAHHYSKGDDVKKQGIIDKATAAKGDVFAQRIKLKAQGVMEGDDQNILNNAQEVYNKLISVFPSNKDIKNLLPASSQPLELIYIYGDKKTLKRANINRIWNGEEDMFNAQYNSTHIFFSFDFGVAFMTLSMKGDVIKFAGFNGNSQNSVVILTPNGINLIYQIFKEIASRLGFKNVHFDKTKLETIYKQFEPSPETYSNDRPSQVKYTTPTEPTYDDLMETTTTGSAGGQYSSKYFLDKSHAKNPPLTFKGGAVVAPNPNQHTQGIGSFKVIKGQLKEDIMKRMDDMFENMSNSQEQPQQMQPIQQPIQQEAVPAAAPTPVPTKNIIPKSVMNRVIELQGLIEQAVDSDGDKMGVEDRSGSISGGEDFYTVTVENNVINISYFESYRPSNVNHESYDFNEYAAYVSKQKQNQIAHPDPDDDFWYNEDDYDPRSHILPECTERLNYVLRMYRRVVKNIPGEMTRRDTAFHKAMGSKPEIDEDQMPAMDTPDPSSQDSQAQPDQGFAGDSDEMDEQYSTEGLHMTYENVCKEKGADSEEANQLKNVLIEFGDYENPQNPINSQALTEFKRILDQPVQETTGAASSGQYNGPLQGRPTTSADRIFEDQPEGTAPAQEGNSLSDGDIQTLKGAFGEENVRGMGEQGNSYIASVTCNGLEYMVVAFIKDGGMLYGIRPKSDSKYTIVNSIDQVIDLIGGYDGEADQQYAEPAPEQQMASIQETDETNPSGCLQQPISEETLAVSSAISNLNRIHAETARITKADMQRIKKDTLKATTAQGTQFIDNTGGVETTDSENAIGIDNTPQQDEIAMIEKGMEDLHYAQEPGEDFEERFKNNIDPDLSTEAVTDQFGFTTPADKMANVLPSNVGKDILANVKKKQALPTPEMYEKDPQPVKIVKEGIFKETDDYVITESEQKLIKEEAEKIKKLMGYKPEKNLSTKGNKRA